MKLKIYSIRDSKAEIFNTPFYQKTHGEAERNFRSLVNDDKSQVHKYPEDYALWYLGEYDDQTAKFDTLSQPQHMINAIDAIMLNKSASRPDLSPVN